MIILKITKPFSSIYDGLHRIERESCLESTPSAALAATLWGNGIAFPHGEPYRTELWQDYIRIWRFGIKSYVIGSVLAMTGSVRSFHVDLVRLIGVSVCSLAIEGSVIFLVGVMMLGNIMFWPFCLELLSISGFSLETARTRAILVLTGCGSLDHNLGGDILLLILGGVVKLGSIGLIGVLLMSLCGGTSEGLIIDSIGGLEKIGVVVAVC